MNSFLNAEIQFPDGDFSMSAIARMKVTAGIDICRELAPKHRQMIKELSLPQSLSYDKSEVPTDTIISVFEKWLDGKTPLPHTWEEMMKVLRGIGMNHLAECIEKYFGKSPAGSKFSEKSLTTSHRVHAALFPGNTHPKGLEIMPSMHVQYSKTREQNT